ncbi:MAG: beta-hydroxyacyl-ACP dehydratase [Thermoguttaceae bacterium]|nr:beta-hydroxyacyl-ACP dehydratase [Thermoguttaceae bacterium]
MTRKPFIVDSSLYDLDKPVATIDDIRLCNRQRFEMEQLTAVVYDNYEEKASVGYKDVTPEDFWVRGHLPEFPLMPGVVMCEIAAQLSSYFVSRHRMFGDAVMGFAGLQEVKFRGMVRPGDRFIIQAQLLKWRKLLITANFMGIVNDNIVCEGILKGCPLKFDPNSSASGSGQE